MQIALILTVRRSPAYPKLISHVKSSPAMKRQNESVHSFLLACRASSWIENVYEKLRWFLRHSRGGVRLRKSATGRDAP